MFIKFLSAINCVLTAILLAATSRADEGLWTFDDPPTKALKEKYGFEPNDQWLEHLRLSAIRVGRQSGALVSPHGLVITSHDVVLPFIQQLSSAKQDFVAHGFYAKKMSDELKCPGLEVARLVATKEVTRQIQSAVTPGMSAAQAAQARLTEQKNLIEEVAEKGLHAEVISLFEGGAYWLYQYETFTDVRLVMAPENRAAHLGGAAVSYTFPRYDLNIAFLRVYRDGRPLQSKQYLKWSDAGAAAQELVFAAGHPWFTSRLETVDQLALYLPLHQYYLTLMEMEQSALEAYAEQGAEQQRLAEPRIMRLNDGCKAWAGRIRSLADKEDQAARAAAERSLRREVNSRPEWKKGYGAAWDRIARVIKRHGDSYRRRFVRQTSSSHGWLGRAVTLVMYVQQVELPDAERLDGFHEAQLASTRSRILSPQPLHPQYEAVLVAAGFRYALKELPRNDALARVLLSLGDLDRAVSQITATTRMGDLEFRRQLLQDGASAVDRSTDPLIVLARQLTPLITADKIWIKKKWDGVIDPASKLVTQARLAVYGEEAYSNATSSLRLTYGTVRGYSSNTTPVPPLTTLYGLYNQALGYEQRGDWKLPRRYWQQKKKLKLATPVNFIADFDIISSDAGSPVVNRLGELVGLVSQVNYPGLAGAFYFDPHQNRGIAVHSAYIIEALRKLYDAHGLADEVQLGRNPSKR